jgi:hypothetical protein
MLTSCTNNVEHLNMMVLWDQNIMASGTRKIVSKEIQQDADAYVGTQGEVWFQEGTTILRFGDGGTPGGELLTGGISDPVLLSRTGVTFGVWLSDEVKFVKVNNGDQVDQIAPGISITRGPRGHIFNPAAGDSYWPDEPPYVQNVSDPGVAYFDAPTNTEWNADGWQDLSDVTMRTYLTWASIMDGNPPALVGQELIMHDVTNDMYHTVKFLSWQYGGKGGAFSYVRRQINISARFTKTDDGSQADAVAPGLVITRGDNGAIFNAAAEDEWDSDVSPLGTAWNLDGWHDLSDVTQRQYLTFYTQLGAGNVGKRILGKPFVMKDQINNQYWKIEFTHWTPNNNGGGFSYVRERIDVPHAQQGISFADGSNQITAFTEQKLGVLPQLRHSASYDRWLNLSDLGKHILVTESGITLRMPDYRDQPFPMGSAITIVNHSGGDIYISMDNDDENNRIWGSGTTTSNTTWTVPDPGGSNMVTLLKIEFNADGEGDGHNWILSGPGIQPGGLG